MHHRRWPSEHRGRGPQAAQRAEHAATDGLGCGGERTTEQRSRDVLVAVGVVRIAAEDAGKLRVVEYDRDAEERDALRQRPLDERRRPPALGAARLEEG